MNFFDLTGQFFLYFRQRYVDMLSTNPTGQFFELTSRFRDRAFLVTPRLFFSSFFPFFDDWAIPRSFERVLLLDKHGKEAT